jgi:hypothetical protein
MRNTHKILVGKPQLKTLHGRPGCKREDNIKMDLKATENEMGMWTGFIWLSGRLQRCI